MEESGMSASTTQDLVRVHDADKPVSAGTEFISFSNDIDVCICAERNGKLAAYRWLSWTKLWTYTPKTKDSKDATAASSLAPVIAWSASGRLVAVIHDLHFVMLDGDSGAVVAKQECLISNPVCASWVSLVNDRDQDSEFGTELQPLPALQPVEQSSSSASGASPLTNHSQGFVCVTDADCTVHIITADGFQLFADDQLAKVRDKSEWKAYCHPASGKPSTLMSVASPTMSTTVVRMSFETMPSGVMQCLKGIEIMETNLKLAIESWEPINSATREFQTLLVKSLRELKTLVSKHDSQASPVNEIVYGVLCGKTPSGAFHQWLEQSMGVTGIKKLASAIKEFMQKLAQQECNLVTYLTNCCQVTETLCAQLELHAYNSNEMSDLDKTMSKKAVECSAAFLHAVEKVHLSRLNITEYTNNLDLLLVTLSQVLAHISGTTAAAPPIDRIGTDKALSWATSGLYKLDSLFAWQGPEVPSPVSIDALACQFASVLPISLHLQWVSCARALVNLKEVAGQHIAQWWRVQELQTLPAAKVCESNEIPALSLAVSSESQGSEESVFSGAVVGTTVYSEDGNQLELPTNSGQYLFVQAYKDSMAVSVGRHENDETEVTISLLDCSDAEGSVAVRSASISQAKVRSVSVSPGRGCAAVLLEEPSRVVLFDLEDEGDAEDDSDDDSEADSSQEQQNTSAMSLE